MPLPGWSPKAHWATSMFFFLSPQMGSQRDLQPVFNEGESQRDGIERKWKEPGPSGTDGSKATHQTGVLTLDCVVGGHTWNRLCPGGVLGCTLGNSTHRFQGRSQIVVKSDKRLQLIQWGALELGRSFKVVLD